MFGRVVGRYRILEKLGEGGMGTVWLADDPLLGRRIAIKVLRDGLGDGAARRRFLREARVASRLDHPGIAAVYDAGSHEDGLFLAVELVEGATLRERLTDGPLPVTEAVRIAASVADALGHAHAHGVAHRDVTASNIMVTHDGRAVLIDFGLAALRDASALTSSGAALGTVGYMAPEVVQGGKADARTDVYGLGVVLYEMLTGVRPFAAERPEAVLYEVMNGTFAPARRLRPDVPVALDRIVTRALARRPDGRFADGTGFAQALRRARGARPPAASEGVWRGPRSRCVLMLPFSDVSSDAQGQLFARGLSEAVSAALAGVPGLEIIPPGSAVGGSDGDAARRALGADLVVHGTVTRAGDRLRVSYLVTGRIGGAQLAGERVDGTMGELLAFEDRVVDSVRRALDAGPVGSGSTAPPVTGDPAAREHYLQALGYLQHRENDASIDAAIALLERLVAAEPSGARAVATLGRAYLAKYRLTAHEVWAARAGDVCRRALAIAPEDPDALLTLGTLDGVCGRHGAAVRVLRRALRARPEQAEGWMELAHSTDALGRAEEAEAACRRAIALRPRWWSTWAWLGYLHFVHGRYADAVLAWRRVVELTPDNPRGHSNLAGAYFQMGHHAEARAAYERSLEMQPTARAYSGLGTVQFMLGEFGAATNSFESATRLQPADAAHWGNLGDAYRWQDGHPRASTEAYTRAIELAKSHLALDPSDVRTRARLAEWLAKCGDHPGAAREIARACRRSGDNANITTIAGVVHTLLGDHAQALACFERALAAGVGLERLSRDPELAPLRATSAYRRFVEEWRARHPGTDALSITITRGGESDGEGSDGEAAGGDGPRRRAGGAARHG